MATRTITEFVDDLDGKPLDATEAETITFSLEGRAYSIDLRPANAERFRKDLAKWTDKATKLGRQPRITKRTKLPSGVPQTVIREWARDNGYEVSDRGRIPNEVREAYEASH